MRGKLNRCLSMAAGFTLAGLYLAAGPAVPHAAASNPAGWAPADLRAAYGLQSVTSGIGMTVALVTAFDDPTAESDLGVYRTQYGLPACTTANGCFAKVNQTGGAVSGLSAGGEQADAESLDAISAVCPNCHIKLVEAASTMVTDLGTANNEAVALGAEFVENDWSIPEVEIGSTETSYDALYFDHPGVAITAPAGDSGYAGGVSYPAASPYVIAVGGTVLTKDTSTARGWDETAWPGSGSGCSEYEAKPSWQTDTGCSDRTLNDTAAVATNLAYYNTTPPGGWATGSGTAISAAIIAAAYALMGPPAAGSYPASSLYAHPGYLNDITSGSNGTCPVSYFCTAGTGYDGPTGLGTPSAALFPVSTGVSPAVYDPVTKNLEVYATSPDGTVEEDSWNKSSGWKGWQDLGGSIEGTPSAIYDKTSGNFEIYATWTDGTLAEDYYKASTGTWSGWFGHGGSLASSPAVIDDTFNGNLEVYATSSNGSLSEFWYNKTTGWHPMTLDAAGSFTGTPSAVANTLTGNVEVYSTGASGTLQETFYNPGDGKWAQLNLGGSITGSPSAVVDTYTGNLEVYATGTDGTLRETFYNPGDGKWAQLNLGGSITGTPTPVVDTTAGNLDIYATGTDGTLRETFYNPGDGKWAQLDLAGSITGSPYSLVDPASGNLEVYATGTGGTLEEVYYHASTRTWSNWGNLGGSIIAP